MDDGWLNVMRMLMRNADVNAVADVDADPAVGCGGMRQVDRDETNVRTLTVKDSSDVKGG